MRQSSIILCAVVGALLAVTPCLAGDVEVDGNVQAQGQLVSSVATGTSPLAVTSTTLVPNLNVEFLGGSDASAFAPAAHTHEIPPAGLVDGPHRRYVSTRGSDSNACTLAAPCRTFAAAITQTGAGGEVVAIDSGDYGPFTVDKALTVAAAPGVYAGIAVFSGAGVTVSIAASDLVVLRGLTIHGIGGEDGIRFLSGAGTLHVEGCDISDFNENGGDGSQGIDAAGGRLFVRDTEIKNASAVRLGGSDAYFDRVRVEGNQFFGLGVIESRVTIRDSVVIQNLGDGISGQTCCGGATDLTIENSFIAYNGSGVTAVGPDVVVRVANSVIVTNAGSGLGQADTASLLSRGDNTIEGNGIDLSGTIGSYSPQ